MANVLYFPSEKLLATWPVQLNALCTFQELTAEIARVEPGAVAFLDGDRVTVLRTIGPEDKFEEFVAAWEETIA